MSLKQKLVTAEELWEMPEVAGKNLELVDGEVIEVSPAGAEHTGIMFMVAKRLDAFVSQHGLGVAMPEGLGFVLRRDPDLVREPDVSFITTASVPAEGLPKGFWEGPPTLAVEIISPNDRATEIDERVHDYLEAGTQMVWVLWPKRRAAAVYRTNADTREFGPDAMLDGGDVLPGFSVRVGDLFDLPRRR